MTCCPSSIFISIATNGFQFSWWITIRWNNTSHLCDILQWKCQSQLLGQFITKFWARLSCTYMYDVKMWEHCNFMPSKLPQFFFFNFHCYQGIHSGDMIRTLLQCSFHTVQMAYEQKKCNEYVQTSMYVGVLEHTMFWHILPDCSV